MPKTLTFPAPGIDILDAIAPPPREPHPKTSHYASGIEGCPRKDYYRWLGIPETNPASDISRGKMQAGNDAHDLFAMKLGRVFPEVETEIPVEIIDDCLTYPIHGRLDALFYDENGERYVVEYKSTQLTSTTKALEAPRFGHLMQLWTYMQAEGPEAHYYLVYEDRGSKLGVEYEVAEIDGQLYYRRGSLWTPVKASWDAVIAKLAMIERAVGDEEPPERVDPLTGEEFVAYLSKDGTKIQQTKTVNGEVSRTHWMCMGYCAYRDHCWLGGNDGD